MEDAVAVALEAGAERVGLLGERPGRRRPTARVAPGARSAVLALLALLAAQRPDRRRRLARRESAWASADPVGCRAPAIGGRPALRAPCCVRRSSWPMTVRRGARPTTSAADAGSAPVAWSGCQCPGSSTSAQLNVQGGDGGAGCVVVPARGPRAPRAVPTAATAARAATCGWSPTATSPRCSAFRDHPHRRAANGAHGQGKKPARPPRRRPRSCPCPRAPWCATATARCSPTWSHDGDRWLAAAGGRGGRGNARFLSNRRRAPSFAEQGEVGEERWLRARAQADGRRRARRVPQRRQEHADLAASRRPSRRSPTTPSPRSSRTSAWCGSTTASSWWWPTSPASSRAPARARASGHQFLRHVERARVLCVLVDLAPIDGAGAGRAGARCCSTSSAPTSPSCSIGPGWSSGSKADVAEPTPTGTGRLASRRSPARACAELVGRAGRRSSREARAGASRADEAFVVHRPDARGLPRSSATTTASWRVDRARGRAGRGAVRPHQPRGARLRRRPAQAARRRQGARPGRRPARRHRAHRRLQLRLRADDERDGAATVVVAKIGTSSITDDDGVIDVGAIAKLCAEVGRRCAPTATGVRGRHLRRGRRRAAARSACAEPAPRRRSRSRRCRPSARAG